jgi:hypothetical protein
MVFRITSIDKDGFNGRDLPPQDRNVGQMVVPVKMETLFTDAEGQLVPMLDHPDILELSRQRPDSESQKAIAYAIEDGEAHVVSHMWTVVNAAGEFLECMDHELELVRS